MKTHPVPTALLALGLAIALPVGLTAQRSGAAEVLTNQTVIAMTSAKLDRNLMIAKINTTKNAFDVTVNGLINLYQGKVHADVMRSMITVAADPKLGAPAPRNPEVLENQSVVQMVVGKVPKAVIMVKIQNTKCNFDVTATGMVNLTQAKVPSDIIKAMIAKSGSSQP